MTKRTAQACPHVSAMSQNGAITEKNIRRDHGALQVGAPGFPKDQEDIPADHYLTHLPKRNDCDGCVRGKMCRTPAKRMKEPKNKAANGAVHLFVRS